MSETIWRQISAQKDVSADKFARGVQDYNFSMGQPTCWIPSKSYFKIDVTIEENKSGTWTKPANVALAENAPSAMFNNVYFRAGGQDVSSLTNFVGQVQQAKTRLQKTYGWQKSVGKAAYMIESNYDIRSAEQKEQNTVSMLWQPPIGIFDHSEPMGAGDYRIQLNPNTDYAKACVEAKTALDAVAPGVAGTNGNYRVTVEAITFYVCTVKMSIPPGVSTLQMLECLAQSKTAKDGGQLEFTVPASTRAITVFVQAGAAGSNTVVPPTKFTAVDGSEKNLTSLQITYANVTKPSTRWDSKFDADTNQVQQRYLETHLESGLVHSEGGAETLKDYTDRGFMYHFSFAKDSLDKSTQVQLALSIPTLEANANVFILAWHSRATRITSQNGYVVNVESFNV